MKAKPLMEIMPTLQKEISLISEKTAEILNKYLIWSYRTLSGHRINSERISRNLPPVNALVTQRAGKKRPSDAFQGEMGIERPVNLLGGDLPRSLQ